LLLVPALASRLLHPEVPADATRASRARASALECPGTTNLGKVRPGVAVTVPFEVHNRGREPIEVARIETSCECVQVLPPSARVEPSGSFNFSLKCDAVRDDGFRGRLAVDINGFDAAGRSLFQGRALVEVEDADGAPRRSAEAGMPR
jgi:hypothetical protein